MKLKRRVFLVILIVFFVFLLLGCWDRVEIEDRGYIFVFGVDKYDLSDLNKYEIREYIDFDRKIQKFFFE